MKTKFEAECIVVLCMGMAGGVAFGHDVPVHRQITKNAAASALAYSSPYGSFSNTISFDIVYKDAVFFMVEGSAREDDPVTSYSPKDAGGWRSVNHFYDPLDSTHGKGLSDFPPDLRILEGTNSFAWASVSNCAGVQFNGPRPTNNWSWQNARGYEWVGLTATSQAERITALTNMFRAVGQVMHLLEDTSQPQHVRNEQHLDKILYSDIIPHVSIPTIWRSPIEDYGADHVDALNYQQAILDWRAAGFTKLEDFWDRHLYNRDATVLNNAENGGPQLGLAEWSNGNFLGDRHKYAEYYQAGDIKYYPYPSRNTGTDYKHKISNLVSGIQTLTFKNGQQGKAIYLNKTGDGVTFPDHGRFDYFGAKFPRFGMLTIRDDNVLSNYHNVLIPKAVKYSAGLLDYFFRGSINACIVPGSTTNSLGLFFENKSGTNFYNGTVALYSEDAAATRTLILTTNIIGSLDDNDFVTFEFTPPSVQAVAYIAAYQGTIGTTNGSTPLDPIDAAIAIAAKRIIPKYPDTTGPTPNSLLYSDPADLNQVTVNGSNECITNEVSFGNIAPGEYQINYVSGGYTPGNGNYFTIFENLFGYGYGTYCAFNADYVWDNGVETVYPYHFGPFAGANYYDGTYTLADVQTITATNNPEADFVHIASGPITLKLGHSDTDCEGDSGAVTFQLHRVASLYSQPTQLRIKNYATEVKPLLTACTNCMDATSETEWGGNWTWRDWFGASEDMLEWYPDGTFDYLSINGKMVDTPFLQYGSVSGVPCWQIFIYCVDAHGNELLMWHGYKTTGANPIGRYFRNPAMPMCADGLCCLEIESY